ncbi:MAG: 2-isopropylmalate synthase, partial [Okeania sp. SIO2D1]|nr:2-isopropylmalate synthase [Okeania sp. SIO2D1]
MKSLRLKLFDETLRDGEQQTGIFFSYKMKKKLAYLIAQTRVDCLDIMPFISESETSLVKALVSE